MSMFQKLKQFKDMRDQAKTIHEKLAKESCEGSASFGKVKVTINGAQEILSVHIDETLMSDRTKLEGLVKDAANDAIQKCHRLMAEKMKGQMGDMQLPNIE